MGGWGGTKWAPGSSTFRGASCMPLPGLPRWKTGLETEAVLETRSSLLSPSVAVKEAWKRGTGTELATFFHGLSVYWGSEPVPLFHSPLIASVGNAS